MKTFLRITAAVAMATACMAATAQSAGTWSVRLGATRIDPQTSSGWLSVQTGYWRSFTGKSTSASTSLWKQTARNSLGQKMS